MRKRHYRARVWLNEKEYRKLRKQVNESNLSQEVFSEI